MSIIHIHHRVSIRGILNDFYSPENVQKVKMKKESELEVQDYQIEGEKIAIEHPWNPKHKNEESRKVKVESICSGW